tara:strand:- start:217 stop:372 length:156 start_codon:yes stop_codon:yes gene_type:complete
LDEAWHWQKWLQKSVGSMGRSSGSILHNFHYNYGFGDAVGFLAGCIIMPIM